jgi:predicted RND superfamily exporter protein
MIAQKESQVLREASFRRRILGSLGIQLYGHPFLASLCLIALTVFAVWRTSRLEVGLSLRALIPPDPREQAVWDSVHTVVPPHTVVTAVIEFREPRVPDEETRERIADLFDRAWDDAAYISSKVRVPYHPEYEEPRPLSYPEMLARLRPEDFDLPRGMADPRTGPQAALTALRKRLAFLQGKDSTISTETLSAIAADPVGFLEIPRGRGKVLNPLLPVSLPPRPYVEPAADNLVFVLFPTRPASEFFYCLDLRKFLIRTTEAIEARNDPELPRFKLSLYGRHIDTASSAIKLGPDMARAVPVMTVCLMLLLILAFRKVESFVFVLLPPCAGLFWTYGAVTFFTRELGLFSALFPILLMAVGVEFSIQVYHRFQEELARERRFYPALAMAYAEAGRGVIVSSVAMALIFLSLRLSQFQNLREISLAGGLGVISMALAVLLFLPPLAAIKSKMAGGAVAPLETWDFGLSDLSGAVISSPRSAIALGLLVTAYLAFFTRDTRINTQAGLDMGDPRTLSNRKVDEESPNLHLADKPVSILIEAATREEALERNDRLFANLENPERCPSSYMVGAVRSLSPALPSLETQRAVRRELARLDLATLDKSLETAARTLNLPPNACRPFGVTLRGLREFASTAPLLDITGAEDGPLLSLAQGHIVQAPQGGGYRVLTTVFVNEDSPLQTQTKFDEFCRAVTQGLPSEAPRWFLSESQQNRKVAETVIYSMALMVVLSILSLVVCLMPHFRWRVSEVLLAMVPLACTVVWTLGLQAILGFDLGLYALLMLPVVIGIAVNQAVLFIQRLHDRHYASLRQVMRSGGRPGLVSGLALGLAMGCLAQVRFQPLQEMAIVGLIAVLFSTLSTLILVPAILQIRQEGGLLGWNPEEDD